MHGKKYDICIEGADVLRGSPWWRWDTPGYENRPFLLWFITNGKGMLHSGNTVLNLGRGDCVLSPLWYPHHGRHSASDYMWIHWVRFLYLDKNGEQTVPDPMPILYRKIGAITFLEEMLSRCIEAFRRGDHRTSCLWLNAVLLEIENEDKISVLNGSELALHKIVHAISKRIRENPGKAFHVKDICKEMHCTPDHCIRIFKRFLGITPYQLIVRSRIEKACRYLRFSDLTIKVIAHKLGYGDIHHFSRQFHEKMGVTPGAYRMRK